MYSVAYSDKAIKTLQKLDRHTAAMIYGWIDKNLEGCSNPRLHGKVLNYDFKGYLRYRIGVYRLIANIQDNLLTIEIIKVGHRREIYGK
jgi:mRNA interferase RelE/StbE